jgi:hypothetical protein
MLLDTDSKPDYAADDAKTVRHLTVSSGADLSSGAGLTERAAALLRDHLRAQGLDDYEIYFSTDLNYPGIEQHLEQLGGRTAWTHAVPLSDGGEPVAALQCKPDAARSAAAGFLRLARHRVVLARWHWRNGYQGLTTFWLCAARSLDDVNELMHDLRRCQQLAAPVWQILQGGEYSDADPVPREPRAGDRLIIPATLRARIESEVISFFSDDVVKLYASLDVPHRRGVLLHGPPGNGKTSIIRWIGAALPRVAGLILRPNAAFDNDDLNGVVKLWKSQAPAILVIEDLNWLLKKVDLSLFLNLLDGIERDAKGGQLLIATTNHPSELDPAINNRPGRFDVVIEIPCPDDATRLAFLAARLADVAEPTRAKLAALTDGFSFAHLHELLRVSGLRAIHDGRDRRTDADLLAAVETLRSTIEDAARGFPGKPELPFGLHHIRTVRQAAAAADANDDDDDDDDET